MHHVIEEKSNQLKEKEAQIECEKKKFYEAEISNQAQVEYLSKQVNRKKSLNNGVSQKEFLIWLYPLFR